MKKNYMMRLAAVLLVLVLLSTCVISGTFAKYVTDGSASDEARVAKWGVTIDAKDDGDSKAVLDADAAGEEAQISVAKEMKLLAPGTKGDLVNVNVEGKPEVAVIVEVVFNLDLTGWKIGEDEYCPLVFTVKVGESTQTFAYTTSVAKLEKDVEDYVNAVSQNYAADTDFSKILDLAISWEWAYSVDDATDVKDTALGDLNEAPKMKVSYNITMTQEQ